MVSGMGVWNSTSKSSPLSLARTRMSEHTSTMIWLGEQGTLSTVILPASILERSRMSLMSESRCSPLRRMVCTWLSRSLAVMLGSSSRSAYPITAVIGVRISWDMFARNSLFERLASVATASSAPSRSTASTERACCSVTASVVAWRAAISHISRCPRTHDVTRKTSSKTTQPMCSSERISVGAATPYMVIGSIRPRATWSTAVTAEAVISTRQSR